MSDFKLTPYAHLLGYATMNYETESEAAARELCGIMAKRLESSSHGVDQYFAKCLQQIAAGADPAAALNLKKRKGRREKDPSTASKIHSQVIALMLSGEAETPEDAAVVLEDTPGFPLKAEQILNIFRQKDRTKKRE